MPRWDKLPKHLAGHVVGEEPTEAPPKLGNVKVTRTIQGLVWAPGHAEPHRFVKLAHPNKEWTAPNEPLEIVQGFDSVAEARRFDALWLAYLGGDVLALRLQPLFRILDGFTHQGSGLQVRAHNYTPDFCYYETTTGPLVVEEVKGHRTRDFSLRRDLFLKRYPMVDFRQIDAADYS